METIKDILREMRGCAGCQERMGFYDLRNLATETLRVFADRIEAARNREVADALDTGAFVAAAAKRETPAISEDRKRYKYEKLHECYWDNRAVQCVIRQMLDERDDLSSIDSVSANRMDYFAKQLIGAARDDGKSLGSGAKMREALEYLRDASREFHHLILNSKHNEICDKYKYAAAAKISDAIANANAALAAPLRNCDVGTEQEQQDRFREFCRHYESEGECGIGRSKAACPAFQGGRNPDCSLWWGHMPFEEGGAR